MTGIVGGVVLDRVCGDPRRFHPVAGFGRVAGWLERRIYADSRAAGASYAGLLVGATVAGGVALEHVTRHNKPAKFLVTALATWTVLGGRSLEREAEVMSRLLGSGDLAAARQRLSHLCSRDASELDEKEVARATVESVAENSSDAVVAPLAWGGLFGIPGLLGYRVANTLDAMVGYRSARYRKFGWASARLDDAVNYVPARVCAVLTGLVSGRPGAAWRVWRRDAYRHPSPNAGPVEASYAGALGITLGGTNRYGENGENGEDVEDVEDRGTLGDGPPPTVADIRRTARLSRRVGLAAAVVAVVLRRGLSRGSGLRRRWPA